MAKCIMVQGTMSNAGKSLIAAGLCRVFRQDGYRVAPFKSQNMALNSFITEDGLEMGRAQVMQAEAAGVKPDVCMNPILLKPTNDVGSQVIVNGEVLGNMSARAYFAFKKQLVPEIRKAWRKLEEMADIIVIEGAGSPAEINLKQDDIVNMGLAKMLNAPVLLVGDIDRGGVFAQLLGTLMLLEEDERALVKGLVINKFRGDKTILDPGIVMLEERGGIPVTGVIPYTPLQLEDEDSLTERFENRRGTEASLVDLAVIRFPRISNFTDFNVFEQMDGVSVRYVTRVSELKQPDLILLPGSKNTMGDLKWMRESGMEAAVKKCAQTTPVFGICGGYQMLGMSVSDPEGCEEGGTMRGMELLKTETVLRPDKTRKQVSGTIPSLGGCFRGLAGKPFVGYEIHMGETRYRMASGVSQDSPEIKSLYEDGTAGINQEEKERQEMPVVVQDGNVYGTYVHGIFDAGGIAGEVADALAERKGVSLMAGERLDYREIKEREYDRLAEVIRTHMDMRAVYRMMDRNRETGH